MEGNQTDLPYTGRDDNHKYNRYNNNIVFNATSYPGAEDFEHTPSYITIYVTVINTIIFGVGTIGNVLVILVVCKVRSMRNPTNYFLFTLSIADLLVLLVCQPVALMEFYAKERWYLGEVMCKYRLNDLLM